jgi:hypothetical protein
VYFPALILMMFHWRRSDWREARLPETYEFSWSRTLRHGHEALLGYALMALVLLPIIAWAVTFVLVVSMFDGMFDGVFDGLDRTETRPGM